MKKTKQRMRFDTEHVEYGSEDLPCDLTAAEYDARTQQAANVNQEIEALAVRKKGLVGTLDADRKRLEADRSKLTMVVKNRQEYRPVQVEVFKDFSLGEMVTVRLDKREVVRSRPLLPDERQLVLPEKTAGEHVSDKPPKSEKGKKLLGRTRKNDVEKKAP